MNETILDFEGKLRAATKERIPLPEQIFVANLRVRLNQANTTAPASRGFQRGLIARTTGAVLLLVVAIVALLGPSDVFAAVQRLVGYIPGVGFIQPELNLSEPVTIQRGGASITVENLVVSSAESILVFTIKDPSLNTEVPISSYRETAENPYLQTPDGAIYQPLSGQGRLKANGHEWFELIRFPSLPSDTASVFFIVQISLPDGTYESLQLELPLEAGSFSPESDTGNYVRGATSKISGEVEIRLSGAVIKDNQLVLNLIVDWENPNWQIVEVVNFEQPTPKGDPIAHFVTVTDSDGSAVPISLKIMESSIDTDGTLASFVFSSEMPASEIAFPATLTLDAIYVSSFFPLAQQPVFSFTPKTNVIPGECEALMQSIGSNGIDAMLSKACYLGPNDSMSLGGGGGGDTVSRPEFGLQLWFSANSDVAAISVGDIACRKQPNYCAGSGSMSREAGNSELLQSIHLYTLRPDWPVEFSISSFDFLLRGPWSIEFEPPE